MLTTQRTMRELGGSELGGDTGAETVSRDLLTGGGLSTKDLLTGDDEERSKDLLPGTVEVLIKKLLTEAADPVQGKATTGSKTLSTEVAYELSTKPDYCPGAARVTPGSGKDEASLIGASLILLDAGLTVQEPQGAANLKHLFPSELVFDSKILLTAFH